MWGAKSHIPAAHFALVASSCHRQLGCKFVERLALIHPLWFCEVCCNVGRDQLASAVVAGLWISGGLKKQNCKGSNSNNWHRSCCQCEYFQSFRLWTFHHFILIVWYYSLQYITLLKKITIVVFSLYRVLHRSHRWEVTRILVFVGFLCCRYFVDSLFCFLLGLAGKLQCCVLMLALTDVDLPTAAAFLPTAAHTHASSQTAREEVQNKAMHLH